MANDLAHRLRRPMSPERMAGLAIDLADRLDMVKRTRASDLYRDNLSEMGAKPIDGLGITIAKWAGAVRAALDCKVKEFTTRAGPLPRV